MKKKLLYIAILFSSYNFAQTTVIPDVNFEQALINLGIDNSDSNGNTDGFINNSDVTGVTSLNIVNQGIGDLSGIEAFINLGVLDCRNNSISSVDLSSNTVLNTLLISQNDLTTLDLSNNTALFELNCKRNSITSLNLSSNSALAFLYIDENMLTSIDVSSNVALQEFDCSENNLSALDLSSNVNLNSLIADSNQLIFSNVILPPNIIVAVLSQNNLGAVDLTTSTSLITFTAQNANISSLTVPASMQRLDVFNNSISTIDLSSAVDLINLGLGSNNLTSLDISSNTKIRDFRCGGNQITELDLSSNVALTAVRAASNQLTSLNVKNGNNSAITTFSTAGNTNLQCIEVDNEADATAGVGSYGSWDKESTTFYSENCSAALTLDEIKIEEFSIFPNPITDRILRVNSEISVKSLVIYDAAGRIIQKIEPENQIMEDEYSLKLMKAGVYFVLITATDQRQKVIKLIKS